MRKTQRRASAREWIRSGANITIKTYTKRYGVDRYTAHDDLTALGFPLPTAARQWAQRPGPPQSSEPASNDLEPDWITPAGRPFFAAGYTCGGAPYGTPEEEMLT